MKEEADRKKRAEAEKTRWEQMRAREREAREREAREKAARERMEKEKAELAERAARERAEKERADKERAERTEKAERARAEKEETVVSTPTYGVGERTNLYGDVLPKATANTGSPRKTYERPTAKSYAGTETAESYRPYDHSTGPKHQSSQSSFLSSEYNSDAPSQSTARTSPPPSQRGPYSTKDPDKVMIKGVYLFSDSFPKPIATLVAGEGGITDGLILRITTEGMFVDDDRKGQGLRQWDVKAWTMKGVEVNPQYILTRHNKPLTASVKTTTKNKVHIVRATIRDAENKKYVFLVPEEEEWKVAVGLQRLRRGTQVRSFALTALSNVEAARLLGLLGWL